MASGRFVELAEIIKGNTAQTLFEEKTVPAAAQKYWIMDGIMQMNLKRMLPHLSGIKRTLNLFLINHVFVGTKPLACYMKRKLLRGIGCPVGDGPTIVGPIECKGTIAIGNNCWIGKNCKVNGNGTVQIGDNCDLGPEVTFQTGGHAIGDSTRRAGRGRGLSSGDWKRQHGLEAEVRFATIHL